MKRKQKTELHGKTVVELRKQLTEAQHVLFQQQMDLKMNSLKNLSSMSVKRDEIAVIKTIIAEKQREEQNQNGKNA
jgi:ribosomal protein L29